MGSLRKLLIAGGIGVGAAVAAQAALRRSRWFSFFGKNVLITGGSRGLGLVLARQLADAGARVALCARTEADVRAAGEELGQRGGDVLAIVCDVRRQGEVASLVKQVEEHWGHIDVLMNVAGVIQVGPLEAMTLDDFREAMDVHFWGPLYATLAVLPEMRRRGFGRIVNVSSIGAKQAVPHLIPYVASKYALLGLSHALRTELARENILVTAVCPSLMRTGSPRNALFKGQHRAEYAWFTIGDSLPLVSVSAEQAAAQILRACQRGDVEAIITNPLNPAVYLPQYFPELMTEVASLVNRFLPEMGGIGQRQARGYESQSAWAPSLLTSLTELAAERNNEMRSRPTP
jgi:NAD(P)-dependent dehydrogenase (short-subunit alcohol dehydrogenase family)